MGICLSSRSTIFHVNFTRGMRRSMGSLSRAFAAIALASQAAAAQSVAPHAAGITSRNDFPTEAEAKRHCGSKAVVWVVPSKHVYFRPGNSRYGVEDGGAFMCENDARGDRNRLARKAFD
jgi:hypothetical protein